METDTVTRTNAKTYRFVSARTLTLAGFALMIVLGTSSLALYTRTVRTQESDKSMPALSGDAALEYLMKDSTFSSLSQAIAETTGRDDLIENPEAVVKLTANDARPNDYFGGSVAISGDTAIVGAPQLAQGNGGLLRGSAYIFVRNGAGWSFQQKLTGTGSDPDGFARTVGISGNTVVVGAPTEGDFGEDDYGAAYVFVRTGTTWTLQKKFSPTDTPLAECEGEFGQAVAVSGETVLISTNGCLQFSDHESFVHVFIRQGTVWTQQALLKAPDEFADDFFGHSLALSGDAAVISDLRDASPQVEESAYIFVRCGVVWTQQQRLTPNDGASVERGFGRSIAISGNTVLIGAPEDRPASNNIQGSAYIFVSDGTTWTQQQKLTANDSGTSSRFGFSVAIMGDTAIVGKPFHATVPFNQGFAFAYVRTGTTWALQQTLTASDGVTGDLFGSSVAISNNAVFIGAQDDDFGSTQTREGSAYAIDRITAPPPPLESLCDEDIEVNITTDQPDIDLGDDECDVDMGQSGLQCSLRAAIQTANAKSGPDEIKFDIPGGGTHTISPVDILPPITEKVSIDATTQPGYSSSPLVELRGSGQNYGLGFATGSNQSSASGLAINRFQAAIAFQSSGNRVEKCYMGLSPAGAAAGMASEQLIGVDIRSAAATNNTIGGAGGLGNVISNNGAAGVAISEGTSGNKVFGNKIGTNPAGTAAIPNVIGVLIDSAGSNRIGDTVTGTGNLISGNSGLGIGLRTGSSNNLIAGNLIGTNAAGTEAIANASGVIIDASNNNRVGSDTGQNGNLISGNTSSGVGIGTGSSGNVIGGNKIGTNLAGTAAIPNQVGVGLDASNGNTIGDAAVSTNGNLISGNAEVGVVVQTNSATNTIANNQIGTRANGTEVLPNGRNGIFADTGATANIIKLNTIGGHSLTTESAGIVFGAAAGINNLVTDNSIGVVAGSGTTALPNLYGIAIFADGQKIGAQSAPNFISKNTKAGIFISNLTGGPNPVVENNDIRYNLVGTNGTDDLGNGEIGIWVNASAANNTITRNVVSGNDVFGIALTDGPSTNTISLNFVGTTPSGNTAIPNNGGIWIRQASNNNLDSNLVSGNSIGILVGTNFGFSGRSSQFVENYIPQQVSKSASTTYTSGNQLVGNVVGLNSARTAAIPGSSIGIVIGENARNNLIGTTTGSYNLISGNTATIGYGIFLGTLAANPTEDSLPQFNTFQGNVIGLGGSLQTTIANTKGFVLLNAVGNTIGGTSEATANYIVASTEEGIAILDGSRENTFLKNFLGVLPPGFAPPARPASPPNVNYGNGGHGILVSNGAQRNTLGGSTPGTGLVIANNGGNGINIASTAGSGNRIGTNSIYGNALPGIDLGGNGFTVNDPADADVGPNNLQNYPTMTFSISGGNLIVNYQVDSAPANSVYGTGGIKVDFYEADPTGQGSTSLGTDQYLLSDYANGTPGTRQKNLGNAAALGFVAGDRMTATSTDADGNSSEFTPAVNAPGGAPGFEGDVAPRPNGDGNMLSTDITQLRRFVAGLDTPNTSTNEVQRIDCAPRSTGGDGVINSTDVVQGRRYVSGLDPLTPSAGPARPSFIAESFTNDLSSFLFTREMRIGGSTTQPNRKVSVPIEMNSNGNETAVSFTIEYDAKLLANPRVALGEFAPFASTLTINTNESGRIGILIDSNEPMTASAMPQRVLTITFDLIVDGESITAVKLTSSLAVIGVSDAAGNSLAARYLDGNVILSRK